MPDYRWEVAQSQKSGDYWRPKYVPGTIGKDAISSPGYYVNGAGVRVDPSNPSSWYMLPGGVSAAGQSGVPFPAGSTSSASGNPFSTISNIKSQPLQDAINKALGNWNADSTTYDNALNKFQTESNTSRAATRGFMDQENANVGGYFNGAVSSNLAALLAKAEAANALAADQASNQALRAYKTAGLSGASDVYRTRMIDAALQGIRAQQAKENADREQANYQWLSGMQRGLLGQRAGAESAYVDTALKPLTARLNVNQNVLAALGQINAANLANNFYGVNAPYYPSVYGALPTYGGGYGPTGYSGYPGGYYPSMRGANVSTIPTAVRSAVANLPGGNIEAATGYAGGSAYYPIGAGAAATPYVPWYDQSAVNSWLNRYAPATSQLPVDSYLPTISGSTGYPGYSISNPMFYGGAGSPVGLYPGTPNEWGGY